MEDNDAVLCGSDDLLMPASIDTAKYPYTVGRENRQRVVRTLLEDISSLDLRYILEQLQEKYSIEHKWDKIGSCYIDMHTKHIDYVTVQKFAQIISDRIP